jgi:hypothetical protein
VRSRSAKRTESEQSEGGRVGARGGTQTWSRSSVPLLLHSDDEKRRSNRGFTACGGPQFVVSAVV